MFYLKWKYKGNEYSVRVNDDSLMAELVTGLNGLGYTVTEPAQQHEHKLQLCGCSFNGKGGRLYSYVAVDMDVCERSAVIVPVTDECGYESEVLAVVMTVRDATLDDIRAAASAIGRKKLKRIISVI